MKDSGRLLLFRFLIVCVFCNRDGRYFGPQVRLMLKMKKIISAIDLYDIASYEFVDLSPKRFGVKALRLSRLLFGLEAGDKILLGSPDMLIYIFILLLKIFKKGVKIVVVDLILQPTGSSFAQKISANIKGRILNHVDRVIVYNKDISGYVGHYGINEKKFKYIPFKANNYEITDEYSVEDYGYGFVFGTSHRDYQTFFKAVEDIDYKFIVLAPTESTVTNNSYTNFDSAPMNVEVIRERVSRDDMYTLLAHASFVVLPLKAGVLQPAGISTILESMMFQKPVIVSSGSSVNGLFDNGLALVFEPGNEEDLRSKIKEIIDRPESYSSMVKKSYVYVRSLKGRMRLAKDIYNCLLEI